MSSTKDIGQTRNEYIGIGLTLAVFSIIWQRLPTVATILGSSSLLFLAVAFYLSSLHELPKGCLSIFMRLASPHLHLSLGLSAVAVALTPYHYNSGLFVYIVEGLALGIVLYDWFLLNIYHN